MRSLYYFVFVIAIVIAVGAGTGSVASAKTIEAGDASTSWIGTGDIYDLADGGRVVHVVAKGVVIVRHVKDDTGVTVHSNSITCSVQAIVDTKNNQRTQRGPCTVIAHEGKDVAYAQFKCQGDLIECEGEFTFIGGTGGFSGISGTTPFFNRIIFQQLEAGNTRVVGYGSWPKLTYTLP